eukprot:CAMPEP_0172399472 /NCGR_PEP_ID=MMETSP1061-20121228/41246_1 /TAXON_ID=37318 /ORGANISM="Pseudo-nitzschia pungens, Strain cf. pungens" /LENGTH=134 /DNA_ID=CAMNT_0013132367 /DNA_START=90 /DNA_END=495 /DNA_ORIENTATION=+
MEEEQDTPQQVLDLAEASVPNSLRGIRACKRCGILKTLDQFINEGCENCPFLDMIDNPERANMCTSAFYEGQAALMDPRESWAAKWIRVDNYLPGVYALSVTGTLDREIQEDLEEGGFAGDADPRHRPKKAKKE